MAARRKYDWDAWLAEGAAGYGIELERGVDYHCSQSTMAQTIRNNASMRGIRVRLTDTGHSIIIEVISAIHHSHSASVSCEPETTLAESG